MDGGAKAPHLHTDQIADHHLTPRNAKYPECLNSEVIHIEFVCDHNKRRKTLYGP